MKLAGISLTGLSFYTQVLILSYSFYHAETF